MVAGRRGALVLDKTGKAESFIPFDTVAHNVRVVGVDNNDSYGFLSGGSWARAVTLFNHLGKVVWSKNWGKGVNSVAAGDTDADGKTEFVVGFNGALGLCLLNDAGELVWSAKDSNVWQVAMLDTDGDGRQEIVHSNARGLMKVRDGYGKILKEVRSEVYFSKFSLCRWPVTDGRQYIIAPGRRDGQVYIFDSTGKTVTRLIIPRANPVVSIQATPVRVTGGETYFAVLMELMASWHRSILCLYDVSGNLVYQEILPERCQSITVLPSGKLGKERLLIGGEGRVWQYELLRPVTR